MSFYSKIRRGEGDVQIVAQMHQERLGYEYNMFVIFVRGEDEYRWGHSAGCSCYPPFDRMEYHQLSKLETRQDYKELESAINENIESRTYYDSQVVFNDADLTSFLSKAAEITR